MSAQAGLGDIDLDDLVTAGAITADGIGIAAVDADRAITTNSTSASISIPKAPDLGLVGKVEETAHVTVWEIADRYVVVSQIPK